MTVQELKNILEQYPPDTKVMFSYPSGDYWGSTLASEVCDVEEGFVEYSGYHRQYKVAKDRDYEDDDEREDSMEVLILS